MDLVVRAAVVFAFVFLLTRITGRRELSQLEPFDVILLVVLGDLVQQGVTQSDNSVTGALIVISTIAVLSASVGLRSSTNGPANIQKIDDASKSGRGAVTPVPSFVLATSASAATIA